MHSSLWLVKYYVILYLPRGSCSGTVYMMVCLYIWCLAYYAFFLLL